MEAAQPPLRKLEIKHSSAEQRKERNEKAQELQQEKRDQIQEAPVAKNSTRQYQHIMVVVRSALSELYISKGGGPFWKVLQKTCGASGYRPLAGGQGMSE